ncbi:MAG: ABC transporter permease [Bacteroidota bacterium]
MMLLSYIKLAYRNIMKDRLYSSLNVLGLAIGIICSVLIMLYANDELSFDKNWKKYDRIYRLESIIEMNGKKDKVALTSIPLAPVIAEEIPEVESYARFGKLGFTLVKYGEKELYERRFYFADSTVFNLFEFNFIDSISKISLAKPNTIIISKEIAKKYFGDIEPINKTLILDNDIKARVIGVFEDLPKNIHLRYDALLSISTLQNSDKDSTLNSRNSKMFWNMSVFSYVLLKPNATIDSFNKGFKSVYNKYMIETAKIIDAKFELKTTRIDKIHFSSLSWDLPVGNMSTLYIFIAIGIFILIIASINYMNLSTARSASRAKEVGIRKVLGSHRLQIIKQFVNESFVLTLISLVIALGFIELYLPIFNELVDKSLDIKSLFSIKNIGLISCITLVIAFLSGSYPAFYMSSFLPIQVLKVKFTNTKGSGSIRRVLVVFQFFISIILITGTFIIWSQMNFVRSKDLGFNKDNLIVLRIHDTTLMKKIPEFKQELLKNTSIKSASASITSIGTSAAMSVIQVQKDDQYVEQTVNYISGDYDYINTLQIKLLKGRMFNKKNKTDEMQSILINETAARQFGWNENAIGKTIRFGAKIDTIDNPYKKVIGVVKDFNYKSLHNVIEPVFILVGESQNPFINIRVEEPKEAEAILLINKKWDAFFPEYPFDYEFIDRNIDKTYLSDIKMGKMFSYFSVICIFIALLGLFGLSSYIAEQRRKEIAIRKVLGASITSLFFVIYKEFLVLISVAFILGTPTIYLLSKQWLHTFAFYVDLSVLPFVFSGLFSYLIAMLTIFYHIYRVANENPSEVLKYE